MKKGAKLNSSPSFPFIVFLLSLSMVLPASAVSPVAMPAGVAPDRLVTEVLWDSLVRLPVGRRPRVVLVLGGGGARGLSHIGVLRVLEQERIPVDQIVGVSVGALVGALYAAGLPVEKIEAMAGQVGWNQLTDFSNFSMVKLILSDELLSTAKMESYLQSQIGNMSFSDLKIPFTCLATDLRTGDRVVFNEGSVALAARASATIPAIFKPVKYRQRLLVDGGLVDNLPTDIVSGDGQNFILAVMPNGEDMSGEVTNVLKALVRSIDIQKDTLMKLKKSKADVLIEPDVQRISMVDLGKSKECVDAGALAGRKAALEIKKLMIERTLKMNVNGPVAP